MNFTPSPAWIAEMVFLAYTPVAPDTLLYQGPNCNLIVKKTEVLLRTSDQRVIAAVWPGSGQALNAVHRVMTNCAKHKAQFSGLRTALNVQLEALPGFSGEWRVRSHGVPSHRVSLTDAQGQTLHLTHTVTSDDEIPGNSQRPAHLRESQIVFSSPHISSFAEAHNFQALLYAAEGIQGPEQYVNAQGDTIEAHQGRLIVTPPPGRPRQAESGRFDLQLTPSRKARLIRLLRSVPVRAGTP